MPENEFYKALTETQRSVTEVARETQKGIADVAQAVAALQVHVQVAATGIDDVKRALAEDRERARIYRANLTDSLHDVEKRLDAVERNVEAVQPAMEKIVELERKTWKIAGVLGGLGMVIGAGFVTFKTKILAFFGLGG